MKRDETKYGGWTFVMEHQYQAGFDEMSRQLSSTGADRVLLANRGTAALCLGRLDQAREDFLQANSLSEEESGGHSSPYRESLFAVEWISGNFEKAIAHLVSTLEGLKKGRLHYADLAGGVGSGALLYFASIRRGDDALKEVAGAYLRDLAANPRSVYWPGPLGAFLLGATNFDELLKRAGISESVERLPVAARESLRDRGHRWVKAVGISRPKKERLPGSARESLLDRGLLEAKTGVLLRRQLCQALFYRAVKTLEQNDTEGAIAQFADCSALENPLLEVEWFLADFELKTLRGSRK